MEEVETAPMIPMEQMQGDVESFMEKLTLVEDEMLALYQKASQKQHRLKYIAQFENGQAQCALQSVPVEHAFYDVDGRENIVLIYSDRYAQQPLCIRGAGAGAEVTAMGVFADLIRIGSRSPVSL